MTCGELQFYGGNILYIITITTITTTIITTTTTIICDLLQYTHTEKCYLFVKYMN